MSTAKEIMEIIESAKTGKTRKDDMILVGDKVTCWRDGTKQQAGDKFSGKVTSLFRGKSKIESASWKEVKDHEVVVEVDGDKMTGWQIDT